jgi:hypothetical protein
MVTYATLEVLHCAFAQGDAFAQGSFEAIHDSQHEDGGVARSPNEQKNLLPRHIIIREHQDIKN